MKILIAHDGSKYADIAIDDLTNAGLPGDIDTRVLSVADMAPAMPAMYSEAMISSPIELSQAVAESARALADKAMDEASEIAAAARDRVARLFPAWRVDAVTATGAPAGAIIEHAESYGADLVVIGSHGRGAISRMFFGSISQKVVRYAPCSVRVGRHNNYVRSGGLRIVIGMDLSRGSAAAISAVAQRTWPQGTHVRLVTAVDARIFAAIPALQAPSGETAVSTDERNWLADAQDGASEELRAAGLTVSTTVDEGDPKHILINQAELWNADAIFIGAKGTSRIARFLLGSVSASVSARALCSVEVVRFH